MMMVVPAVAVIMVMGMVMRGLGARIVTVIVPVVMIVVVVVLLGGRSALVRTNVDRSHPSTLELIPSRCC